VSEFELAYLFNEMQMAVVTQLALYVSVMSGFLIMSFLAAHRLSRALMILAISLFSWLWYVLLMLSFREMASFSGLMGEMRKFKDAGKGLNWHYATHTPTFLVQMIPISWIAFQLIFYAAAVGFFFHCRHINLRTEVNLRLSQS
jgi:hypothetical protein